MSHTRRERETARDKFEHWIERIKTLHFTSLDIIKIEKDRSYDFIVRVSEIFTPDLSVEVIV